MPASASRAKSSLFIAPRPRAEIHRGAGIEHGEHAQLRLVLVLLDVQPVAAAEQPPVHPPQIVAGLVVAVFGKLDGRTFLRAAMASAQKSIHQVAGAQSERRQVGQQIADRAAARVRARRQSRCARRR